MRLFSFTVRLLVVVVVVAFRCYSFGVSAPLIVTNTQIANVCVGPRCILYCKLYYTTCPSFVSTRFCTLNIICMDFYECDYQFISYTKIHMYLPLKQFASCSLCLSLSLSLRLSFGHTPMPRTVSIYA